MERSNQSEPGGVGQLLILSSYSAMALGLIVETLLMKWEIWALPLIVGGVFASWLVHLRQRMSSHQRIWIYTILMMASFFFYGVHVSSTFDMGLLMVTVMIIYTITGERRLVTFCQGTYYVTLAYDLAAMTFSGCEWDALLISRTVLHIALIFLAGWLSRQIIQQWSQIFQESDARTLLLDNAEKRMNSFMASLSHELRTPVNAILGSLELVEKKMLSQDLQDALQTIQDAGRRMGGQISDICDYSEIETGQLQINREPYMLASLFHDLVSELSGRIPDSLELVIDIDANTPAGLISDAAKIRRILFHIIDNGLKYTREGGVFVRMRAIREPYGVNLCVEVTDTGLGMDESEVENAFRRFYQAESGKTLRTGGLGLGLPIADGFVRALGGFMTIESHPGSGTTVRFSIPQEVSDEQPCMSVAGRGKINLGGYLNIGKFQHPYVREFYNAMILDVVKGLGTPMHRVSSGKDLEKLMEKIHLTHLFVGLEEYLSAADYLEKLAEEITVVVVSKKASQIPEGSFVTWMPKPLYGFPIASILNAKNRTEHEINRIYWPGTRALIVDDEAMNLHVASGILRRYGMEVSTALSGGAAISLCETETFDIVFLDHMMPEMDGVKTFRRIREIFEARGLNCPCIALTANALSHAREMFMTEGFDGFVSKPIEISELERVLKRVLPKASMIVRKMEGRNRSPEKEAQGEDAGASRREAPGEDAGASRREAQGEDAGASRREMPEEMVRGSDLPCSAILNTEAALRYCQGDRELYQTLLHQFVQEHSGKEEKLKREKSDLQNYTIIVHGLKGICRMIGADELSEEAAMLEHAGKAGDVAYIEEKHERFLEDYERLVRQITLLLPPPGEEEDGALSLPEEEPVRFEFEPE